MVTPVFAVWNSAVQVLGDLGGQAPLPDRVPVREAAEEPAAGESAGAVTSFAAQAEAAERRRGRGRR